jgi:nitrate reductase NapAB chaperone NapD
MKPLDEPFHDVSEILLVLGAKHANEVNDLLDQLRELEVDVLDQSDEYIFVVVDELVIEVLEQNYVPVNHNFSGVCVTLRLYWVLVSSELILKLLEYVLKVILVFDDLENNLNHFLVDFLDQVRELRLLPLRVYQNDLDDIRKLVLVHVTKEFPLLVLQLLFFAAQIAIWLRQHHLIFL